MEIRLQRVEDGGGKAPEVHGHHRVAVQHRSGILVPDDAVLQQGDLQRLADVAEIPVLHMAHAPGHGAVGSDGVLQQIAHHGGSTRLRQALQLRIYGAVSVRTVEIVGVDDAEGLVYDIAGTQHRVGRAEGLCPPRRLCIPRRQCRVVLIGVTDLHEPPVRRVQPGRHIAAQALHQLPHIRLDDEHDLVKARPHRVVHTVLHQYLSVGPHAVGLLAAAVAGTDPRRHDDQRCVHSLSSLIFHSYHHTTDGKKNKRISSVLIES